MPVWIPLAAAIFAGLSVIANLIIANEARKDRRSASDSARDAKADRERSEVAAQQAADRRNEVLSELREVQAGLLTEERRRTRMMERDQLDARRSRAGILKVQTGPNARVQHGSFHKVSGLESVISARFIVMQGDVVILQRALSRILQTDGDSDNMKRITDAELPARGLQGVTAFLEWESNGLRMHETVRLRAYGGAPPDGKDWFNSFMEGDRSVS